MQLKTQNLAGLSIIVLLNVFFIHDLWTADQLSLASIIDQTTASEGLIKWLVSPIIVPMLTGLVSPTLKACLLFPEHWKYPLPGNRVFSSLAPKDHRINLEKFGTLPTEPSAQNKLWYSLYNEVKNENRVRSAHRRFLFFRDYFSIIIIFLVPSLLITSFVEEQPAVKIQILVLGGQASLAWLVARSYGNRFATTALAVSGQKSNS